MHKTAAKRKNIYRTNLRKFVAKSKKERDKKREMTLKIVRNSAQEFLEEFGGISEISIIGSVAKKMFFSRDSDTDILVKGLESRDYFKAFSFWEDKLSSPIDLIRYEEVPENARGLLKGRVIIYERTRK